MYFLGKLLTNAGQTRGFSTCALYRSSYTVGGTQKGLRGWEERGLPRCLSTQASWDFLVIEIVWSNERPSVYSQRYFRSHIVWWKRDQDSEACRHGCESRGAWCLFCRGWGGFEGFRLLLVNLFLGLLLSASFVPETWPAFSGNGLLPPSWPDWGMPPTQSHLPRKEEKFESPQTSS